MISARRHLAYWAISGVIILILGTQALVDIMNTGGRGWPIISYGMYSRIHYEGERLDHDYAVTVVLDDLSEVEIDRKTTGMGFWLYQDHVVHPNLIGDQKSLVPIMKVYCKKYHNRVVALRVQDEGVAITRNGIFSGLSKIDFGRINIHCRGY